MKSLALRDTRSALGVLLMFLAATVWLTRPHRLPEAVGSLNSKAWYQAMKLRLNHSALQRYVVFPVTLETDQLLNLGKEPADIRPASAFPRTCQSHQPGLVACRLDDQPIESSVFDITQDFTVEGWFRWHERGSISGANNGGVGTLLSMGDGVHDGFSLTVGFYDGSLNFGLGRPAPKASLVTQSHLRVPPGLWGHLAVVRHDNQLKLYVNGLLAGLTEGQVAVTQPPPWRKFRIGYVGNGHSSVLMDVGEWAVFSAALQDAEILQLAHMPDVSSARQLQAAREALCRNDTRKCQMLLKDISAPVEVASAAKFTAADILRRQQLSEPALVLFENVANSGGGYWQHAARLEAMVLKSGGDRNFTSAMEQWNSQLAAAEQKLLVSRYPADILPVLSTHCAKCHAGEIWCQTVTENVADQILSAKVWSDRNGRATFVLLAAGHTPLVSVCSVSSVVETSSPAPASSNAPCTVQQRRLFRVFRVFRGSGIPRPTLFEPPLIAERR